MSTVRGELLEFQYHCTSFFYNYSNETRMLDRSFALLSPLWFFHIRSMIWIDQEDVVFLVLCVLLARSGSAFVLDMVRPLMLFSNPSCVL